jgi:hypothetical protein
MDRCLRLAILAEEFGGVGKRPTRSPTEILRLR